MFQQKKYYVKSGELEKVLHANSPLDAAQLALLRASGETIDGLFFYVDERGFRELPKQWVSTNDLLPEFAIPHKDVYQVAGDNEDFIWPWEN